MANDLAALQVRLSLQQAEFQKGMQQATRSMGRMQTEAKKTNQILTTMKRSMTGIATSIIGAFSVQALKGTIAFGDQLAKTADKVGLSVNALQELRYAADQTGVPINNLDVAMQRFSRRVGEAASGGGVLAPVFKDLGIEVRRANGEIKSSEEILGEYANAIQGAGSQQERLLLAFKAFDTEGAALVNTLKNGKEGLDELRSAARTTGNVLDESLARKAEQIQSKLDSLWNSIKIKSAEVGIALADDISGALGSYNSFDDATEKLVIAQGKLNELTEAYVKAANPRAREGARKSMEAQRKVVEELKIQVRGLADENDHMVSTFKGTGPAVVEVTGAFDRFGDLIEKYKNSLTDVQFAQDALPRQLQALSEMYKAGAISLKVFTDEKERLNKLMGKGSAVDTEAESWKNIAASIAASVDPVAVYQQEIERLNTAVDKGGLSWEHYSEAVFKAQDALDAALGEEAVTKVNSLGLDMKALTEQGVGGFVDALFDAKQSFGDMATSFLKMIAKMIVQQQILNALQNSSFGASLGFGAAAKGAYADGSIPHGIYTSPTYFGGSKSSFTPFAMGGTLIGENGAGEAVMPLRRGADGKLGVDGGGGGVTVNVINNSGSEISVNENTGTNGMREIEILVEQKVRQSLSNGSMDRTMGSNYGVKRVGR